MTTYQASPSADAAPERMNRRQTLTLIVLLATQFMLAADFSILNVAAPQIGSSLRFPLDELQWIVTAYALASASFALVFGRVGDLLGRRRMFLAGMALIAAASLLGGLAQNSAELIVARVGQGLGTAITTPAALALLVTSFPEGRLRDRALGLNGSLMSAGFTTGAVLGGVLTGLLSWRWAFLINVAVGAIVLVAAPRLLRESRVEGRVSLDLPGSLAVSGGLLATVLGVSLGAQQGWGDPWAGGLLGAGALLLASFWFIERSRANPLISTRMLARRTIGAANLGGLTTFTFMSAVVFLMTLYLQDALRYSALVSGLAFAGLGTAAFLGGMVAPRIIGRLTSKGALVTGLVIQAASTAALLTTGTQPDGIAVMIIATTVGGFGHVLSIVSFMVTATTGVSDEEQGRATAITSVTQQVGITIGTPLISAIATSHVKALQARMPYPAAVTGGVHLGTLVDAIAVAAGAAVIATLLLRPARGRSAPVTDSAASPASADSSDAPALAYEGDA